MSNKDKHTIFKDKVFRRYIYAYLITQINTWMIPALTPILLNKHFGIGKELAFSLGLQWLPSILLGPLTATLIKRWGPHKMYVFVMFFYSIVLALLPFTSNLSHIQLLIFVLGIGQAIASPSSLTLRAYVIPKGMEVAGNSIIIGIQRLSKIIGPLFAGLLIMFVSVEHSFIISAILCYPSILALLAIPLNKHDKKDNRKNKIKFIFQSILTFLVYDKLLLGLFITAIGYTITLGALRIYLLSLAELLGESEQIYSFLLASQGFGALIGAVLSQNIIIKLQRRISLTKIYALVSILEGFTLLLINFNDNVGFVITVLIVASVFETLAFVSYFTILQKRISKEDQGIFNSITMPIIDSSYLIGVIMMGFIINRYSLSIILCIVVSTTILTVFAFIKTFFQIDDSDLASTKKIG
ncbi:putative MFS family arabinose efflux permease [Gracilibacillus halotolerans]|uniref:Putative MFS family arabinose efflux permease n=1 Tax=Gracilibacillus halotolerans TaxID=74386 RepID=A0A841RDH3_9BACI|nr:MFS transporter [Gracilibacillus halotolerans]MBB6512030.1 putative MFS family arabinose efflux permease [Gracilibacillus halotolerans]